MLDLRYIAMNDRLFPFWLRLKSRFPLLLLGQSVDWRRESRVTVTGFAMLWVLAEISRELLGQRRGDLQALTLDHLAQACGSTQWWYCAVLLSGMSAAALWVSCAADGSFGEAVQRFERC